MDGMAPHEMDIGNNDDGDENVWEVCIPTSFALHLVFRHQNSAVGEDIPTSSTTFVNAHQGAGFEAFEVWVHNHFCIFTPTSPLQEPSRDNDAAIARALAIGLRDRRRFQGPL